MPSTSPIGLLGLDRDTAVVLPILVIGTVGVIAVLLLSEGTLLPAFALVTGLAVVLLTFYRIEFGLFAVLAAALLFDQHHIPGFNPPTSIAGYFQNLKENPILPPISMGILNVFELHLLFLFGTWMFVASLRRQLKVIPVDAWGVALLFFAWIAVSFIRGMAMGGDFLPALWEVRALAYLAIMFFAVPQFIRTRLQVERLMWVCIAVLSVKALQGSIRFVGLGFTTAGMPTLTNHEDALFFGEIFVFLIALGVFKARVSQRRFLLLVMPLFALGFYVAQRRAGYAALFLMLPTLFLLLPPKQRWDFVFRSIPIVVCVILYAAIFWESNSRLSAPLRLVKTGLSTDKEEAGDRYYSNLYREVEAYDLAVTSRRAPALGIGFGRMYDQPMKLVDIPFPLRDYIPHNEVLWLFVKTGAVGFFLFWLFLNTVAYRVAGLCSALRDPYAKAVCALIVCSIAGQIVVSFYDLQLTYARNMIFLGTLLGLVPALKASESSTVQSKATQ